MRYYEAKELASPDGVPLGLWHYTVTHDKRTRPAGYCGASCQHHSAAEAEAHYKEFLLTEAVVEDAGHWDAPRPCMECGLRTTRYAQVSEYRLFTLCDEHRHAEVIAKHLKVGWSAEA